MMMTGTGTGPIFPCPKTLNDSVNPLIGCPSQIISAIPENAVCVANVAIKAGIPMVDTMNPFSTPISVEAASVMIIANAIGTPICTIRYEHNTFTNVIIEPVARSISPSRITNVIPTDAIPHTATCLSIIKRFVAVINLGLAIVNPIQSTINTTHIA